MKEEKMNSTDENDEQVTWLTSDVGIRVEAGESDDGQRAMRLIIVRGDAEEPLPWTRAEEAMQIGTFVLFAARTVNEQVFHAYLDRLEKDQAIARVLRNLPPDTPQH